MIRASLKDLDIGASYWLNETENPNYMRGYERIKMSRGRFTYKTNPCSGMIEVFDNVYIKEPEMDKKQKAMERIEAIEAEAAELREILAEEEVTYSIGDRFTMFGLKYLLVFGSGGRAETIGLQNGYSYGCGPVKVGNTQRITKEEFLSMGSGFNQMTRYWDARKQCEV